MNEGLFRLQTSAQLAVLTDAVALLLADHSVSAGVPLSRLHEGMTAYLADAVRNKGGDEEAMLGLEGMLAEAADDLFSRAARMLATAAG
ncbi:hypothetical protein [Solimonas soli]|uniref:hypothetical protein n=1 Tax=Solimonas soli TaxID=413479 RepID=UPI0004830F47|nr:hypothetical protein [Solimonas soli]